MPRSFRLPGLLAALVMSTANAAGPLLLEAAQVKALGIETAVAGEVGKLRQGAYPARVLVPNEQMRIVSAPVAGMVEMLAVAPGAAVKRGQVVAQSGQPASAGTATRRAASRQPGRAAAAKPET
jgi:cobalt-zinc-cadmium efflux system membrane fusion protein